MLQIVIIALGAIVGAMGLMVLAKGELKLSKANALKDNSARLAGGIVIAIGLATVAYAVFILPNTR
jgi:hypothetical protein